MPDPFGPHFVEHERLHRQAVMHDTWGHLFPTETKHGTLVFACTEYDNIVVVQEQMEIDGSPWWYQTIHDFASDLYDLDIFETGDIIKIKCEVTLEQDEEDEDATILVIHPEKIEKMNLEKDFGWYDITDTITIEVEA